MLLKHLYKDAGQQLLDFLIIARSECVILNRIQNARRTQDSKFLAKKDIHGLRKIPVLLSIKQVGGNF